MKQVMSLPEYKIHIGEVWSELQDHIDQYEKVVVLVDDNTEQYCWPVFCKHIDSGNSDLIIMSSGEKNKNLASCQLVWDRMFELGVDRKSLMINLGGGVVGDLGGFCAGTYMRGIDFIQVPTTLLSQVDSSIGGKVGIDYYDIKNSIGLFIHPQAVYIIPTFLETLPVREVLSGYSELLKHALIADDELFSKLQEEVEGIVSDYDWNRFLLPSLSVKRDVVLNDFRETGLRKILNFGHTIGHAIESVLLDSSTPLLHGEAVAIGMIAESYISHKMIGLPESALKVITRYIAQVFGTHTIDDALMPEIMKSMMYDKKNHSGSIRFTLLEQIGNPLFDQAVDQSLIEDSIAYYNKINL